MLVRPEVQALPPFQTSGKAAEMRKLGIQLVAKLDSNEAPWSPFPDAIEAMQRSVAGMNRYPDPSYRPLKEALAELYDVEPSRIVLGNGSGSLIRLLALTLLRAGDEVILSWPPYPAYLTAAGMMGAEIVRTPLAEGASDLEAMLEQVTSRTRLALICNPHNPTGSIVRRPAFEAYLERVPEHVVTVLDEAYHDFVTDPNCPAGRAYLDFGKPIIVLRTFSKIYGLAGLRIGYAFSTPELSEAMQRAREIFPISRLSAEAALASLRRQDLVQERVHTNADERDKVQQACHDLGLASTESQANFLFIDVQRDARAVFDALMRRGILVRSGHVHDAPTWLRVTVGHPEENAAFLTALREVLGEVAVSPVSP